MRIWPFKRKKYIKINTDLAVFLDINDINDVKFQQNDEGVYPVYIETKSKSKNVTLIYDTYDEANKIFKYLVAVLL